MDNFNCAIYDAKGDPGSHRCRALKGVEEDPNCVCNPPSATRSGARFAFKKYRNERRRDARAADKASKPSSPNVNKHSFISFKFKQKFDFWHFFGVKIFVRNSNKKFFFKTKIYFLKFLFEIYRNQVKAIFIKIFQKYQFHMM